MKFVLLSLCFIFTLGLTVSLSSQEVQAALIGEVLKAPESGWKRIDDTDKNLYFDNSWYIIKDENNFYKGTIARTKAGVSGSTFKFKFKGTKFRIISSYHNNTYGGGTFGTTEAAVEVDGVKYKSFSCLKATAFQVAAYNLENLNNDVHTVTNVYMLDGKTFTYDLSMQEVNNFINWFDERSEGRGKSFYLMKAASTSGAYTSHTDCLRYNKISYFDMDNYCIS